MFTLRLRLVGLYSESFQLRQLISKTHYYFSYLDTRKYLSAQYSESSKSIQQTQQQQQQGLWSAVPPSRQQQHHRHPPLVGRQFEKSKSLPARRIRFVVNCRNAWRLHAVHTIESNRLSTTQLRFCRLVCYPAHKVNDNN